MTISWCYAKIYTRVDLSNSISSVGRLHHVRTNFEQIYFPVWNFEPSCLDNFLPNTMAIKHPTNDAIIKSTCFSTRCKFEMSNRCFQAICCKRKIKNFRIENVFLSGILHYIFFSFHFVYLSRRTWSWQKTAKYVYGILTWTFWKYHVQVALLA